MNQRKPSLLAQVANEATITIEQTAELLGLGRTAAYEAARRGDFPTLPAIRGSLRPLTFESYAGNVRNHIVPRLVSCRYSN